MNRNKESTAEFATTTSIPEAYAINALPSSFLFD